jgi:hypothetical protein
MLKLRVARNSIEYDGFFVEPAFELMGNVRAIVELFYKTFSEYGVGLSNFRLDGDSAEPSSAGATVRLGQRGIYTFKFDHVTAMLSDFDTPQIPGFVEVIKAADEDLRRAVKQLSFKSHAFFYSSHNEVISGTSRDFLSQLPRLVISVPGEDLGSGVIQNWRDTSMDAKVSLTLDHSLTVPNGLFVHYRVVTDVDQVDFLQLAVNAEKALYTTLAQIGVELEENPTS